MPIMQNSQPKMVAQEQLMFHKATGSSKAFKLIGGTGQDTLTGAAGADIITGGG